jgi:hypothetical protein
VKKNFRAIPDPISEEIAAVFSKRGVSHEFPRLFEIVHARLKERKADRGGEEMLRLRMYEKLQQFVARKLVQKTGKKYKGSSSLTKDLFMSPDKVIQIIGKPESTFTAIKIVEKTQIKPNKAEPAGKKSRPISVSPPKVIFSGDSNPAIVKILTDREEKLKREFLATKNKLSNPIVGSARNSELLDADSFKPIIRVDLHFTRIDTEGLRRLSPNVRGLQISSFDLSIRTKNCLDYHRVVTLGDLLDTLKKGASFGRWRNFGKKSFQELADFILALDKCISSDGIPDWRIFSQILGEVGYAPIGESADPDQNHPSAVFRYPKIQYSFHGLKELSEESRNLSVDNLHLDCRSACAMRSIGVSTIGDFIAKVKEGIDISKIRNVNKKAFVEISSAVTSLAAAVDATGCCGWTIYAEKRGYPILPEASPSSLSYSCDEIANAVRGAVQYQFSGNKNSERYLDILNQRLLAPQSDKKTLEELAKLHGITRERIRQNEMDIMRCLRGALLDGSYSVRKSKNGEIDYEGLLFRFRPELEKMMQVAAANFSDSTAKVWPFSNWCGQLAAVWGVADDQGIAQYAELIVSILGLEVLELSIRGIKADPIVINGAMGTAERNDLRDVIEDMHYYLQDKTEAVTVCEILESLEERDLNARIGLSPDEMPLLCSTIESPAPGMWKILPEYFNARVGKLSCDIVEKILREKGSRMHSSEIVRKFRKTHGHLLESEDRVLMARMFNEGRFEPIGRTGYWVLKEWGLETGTIREVLPKVLSGASGPMNINDIVFEVRKMIPCAASSVEAYLQEAPEKYTKLGPRTYCLAGREPEDTF